MLISVMKYRNLEASAVGTINVLSTPYTGRKTGARIATFSEKFARNSPNFNAKTLRKNALEFAEIW